MESEHRLVDPELADPGLAVPVPAVPGLVDLELVDLEQHQPAVPAPAVPEPAGPERESERESERHLYIVNSILDIVEEKSSNLPAAPPFTIPLPVPAARALAASKAA